MKHSIQIMIAVLMITSASQAATLKCNGLGDNKGESVKFELVNEKQVKIDDDLADLDEAFSPRSNSDLYRFEYQQSEEGTTEVLVQESLLDGATKGLIKIQNRGEGFSTSSYYCHL